MALLHNPISCIIDFLAAELNDNDLHYVSAEKWLNDSALLGWIDVATARGLICHSRKDWAYIRFTFHQFHKQLEITCFTSPKNSKTLSIDLMDPDSIEKITSWCRSLINEYKND